MNRRSWIGLFYASCLLMASTAHAQVGLDAEFAGFGARALGMGSAFIALSDDATAAEYNPAGLVILERPELAFQTSYRLDRHRELQPVSFGDWLAQGARGAAPRENEYDSYWIPSFASFTYPTKWAVISLSEYSPMYFKRSLTDHSGRYFVKRDWETQLTNYGVSVGMAPLSKLYLGTTLKYGDFRYRQRDKMLSGSSLTSLEGNSLGANFGFIWKMHPWFSLGGVYKTSQRLAGSYASTRIHLKVPRTVGLGVAFHPNDRLRILADVDHIEWSEFLKERNTLEPNYDRDDVFRYHLGAEYLLKVFGESTPSPTALFVRCGAMREDSNRLYYHGTFEPLQKAFPKESPINHLSCGFGIARNRYQLDFAVDDSSKGTQFILSTVVYF